MRHAAGLPDAHPVDARSSSSAATTHYRAQGERHLWNPRTIAALQRAVRMEDVKSYEEYAALINDQSRRAPSRCAACGSSSRPTTPVPLDEVEPATEIVKRFATGAMSFGSISARSPRKPGASR